ncbi:GPI mannosyltransferase 4 [Venturia nashicola]|uniref:feruloyl esterase n=1 Tax=Venturia nashicola TaxID=86259 RepID=A0A4Z1NTQ9_9PEZI|nr:GPI mannosyltransferase 4 [Venturia nashicola]TLD25667.1 GPI mannosyltransferase 4 [Venturia nashicola]
MKTLSFQASLLSTLTLLIRSNAKSVIEPDPSPGCLNSISHKALAEISTSLEKHPIKVSLPPSYDPKKPAPLILVYNDRGVTLDNMVQVTALSDETVNPDAVVVYLAAAHANPWFSDANFPLPPNGPLPHNTDLTWTTTLLTHLTTSYCIDKRRIHASGIGTGGGFLSLLACNPNLSTQIASFAAVSAAFFTDDSSSSPWAETNCSPGRRPISLLEIHGLRDERWGYYPPGVEGEVQGLGPVGWMEVWKERQACGEKVGEAWAASFSNATYVSKFQHGGLSEGVEFGGGAVRIAYRCHADGSTETEEKDRDMRDVSTLTLLHYSLRDVGYGWPRLDLKGEAKIQVNGHEAYPPGDIHFDASKIVLEWFETHPLPDGKELERQAKELQDERWAMARAKGEKAAQAMMTAAPQPREEEGESERWKDEL